MRKFGVGIIGCGNISGIYFKNCESFPNLEVLACADLDIERARAKASEHDVSKAMTVDQLLSDPGIQIVINLTIPKAHAEVSLAALDAGKHVYTEKPLGVDRKAGKSILDKAKQKGLQVGGAPDTFLGAGLQTCRQLIDEGKIGRPVSASAFMLCHGHESWHPAPEFYYEQGGGPMLDMGPYYLTALVSLIGGVNRVCGMTGSAFGTRTLTSQARNGTVIPVETETHIAGLMEFEGGAIGSIVTSFDTWASKVPLIEIHGTEGSISVPDPNGFGGPVRLWSQVTREWSDVPLSHGHAENSRGLGVADLASAIEEGRPPRASGALTYHVLDIMESFYDSYNLGRFIDLENAVGRPEPMP